MRNLLLSALSLLSFCVFAQTNTLKSTDKYVTQVNTFLKENVYTVKSPDHKSIVDGALTGYYLKNRLHLIKTLNSSEFGFIEYSFYVEKDSLLFINERKVTLKEPVTEKEYAEYEKYVLFNTKKGTTDLTKWPLTVDISNDYYFQKRKILKYDLKNFGKPVKPLENELEQTNKDLINRFIAHLEELKALN